MCAADIGPEHGHVADLDSSSLSCTCRACYLLFTNSQAGGGRYRGVPDRYLTDPARELTPAQWDDFQIPVGLAFFLRSSRSGETHAFYPSPAGATESTLNLAAWDQLTAAYPLLAAAEADVEAILICRTDAGVGVLPGPYRRLLRAGRPDAAVLARLRRRHAGAGGHRRLPGPGPLAGAGLCRAGLT